MTPLSSTFRPPVVIAIVVYSLILPLMQVMGEPVGAIGLLVTSPFLPIAYVCGMAMVGLFGSYASYIVGASAAVSAQVVLVIAMRHARAQKKRMQLSLILTDWNQLIENRLVRSLADNRT